MICCQTSQSQSLATGPYNRAIAAHDDPVDEVDESERFNPAIRVIASAKRRRTVSARLRSGVLELLVPASMPHREREHWAEVMRHRLERRRARTRPSDERLQQRAQALNLKLFGGRLRWSSIGYAEMNHRWGSCTFTAASIRISKRAAALPEWVIDYLLVHEMAHLEHSAHGPDFHAMENLYPLSERARGYLMAVDGTGEAGLPDLD
jgi:predicted metal-dependent hydrolase